MSALSAVSKTAVLTLRARADESKKPQRLFNDPWAVEWSQKLPWPKELDKWYTPFSQSKTAIRAHQMDLLVGGLLSVMPEKTTVVELGCGFSTRADRLGHSPWIALDLPAVMEARKELGDDTASIEASVLDTAWIDIVDQVPNLILIAEGLLFYLPRAEIDALFGSLRSRLEGAIMMFDVIGQRDLHRSFSASNQVGAPILWSVLPPFETAQRDFGIDVIPGLEPDKVLEQTIEGFGMHFGPLFAGALRGVSKIPPMRARRSGIMVGTIRRP